MLSTRSAMLASCTRQLCGLGGSLFWLAWGLLTRSPTRGCPQWAVISSVPYQIQGFPGQSIGPTPFLLFVSDFEDVLPDGVELATYADGTTLYQWLTLSSDIQDAAHQIEQSRTRSCQMGYGSENYIRTYKVSRANN